MSRLRLATSCLDVPMPASLMRAVVVQKFGAEDVLECMTVAKPECGPAEVRVAVKAAGLNPFDTYIRKGAYGRLPTLPYVPGADFAGVVDEIGDNVKRPSWLHVGARVFGTTMNLELGCCAEYAVFGVDEMTEMPSRCSFQQCAAATIPYLTAYRALFQKAMVRPKESVLVHGASGGVGTAVAQMAKELGMQVYGTASTVAGRSIATAAGCGKVFDHSAEGYRESMMHALGGSGFDVIVENAAHVNLGHDLSLLAPRGRVVIVGARGPAEMNPRDLMAREASITGVFLWSSTVEELKESREFIKAGLANGALSPIIELFKMKDIDIAHRELICPSDGGARGRLVLNIDDHET